MAKPSGAKSTGAKKNKKNETPAIAPAAFRWQLGGLIAGVVVALLASTEPGKKVDRLRERLHELTTKAVSYVRQTQNESQHPPVS